MSPRRRHRGRFPGVSPTQARSLIYQAWNPQTGEWRAAGPDNVAAASVIISSLRQSNVIETAAEFAKVSPRTVARWIERGRAAAALVQHHDEPSRDDVPELERPYYDFLVEVERAEAASEMRLVTSWNSAAADNWQAASKLLSVRHRRRGWAEPTQNVELTGLNGGPVQIASDLALAKQIANNPEARKLATDLLALVATSTPGGGFDDTNDGDDQTRSAIALG